MNQTIQLIRTRSRGYKLDPPAIVHCMIVVGSGEMLTLEFAKKYKITHVINCASDDMCPSWIERDDNYTCLDAIDSRDVNILTWYPKFKETLQKYLQDPLCKKVFVHCQCGINRSAFLTLMYLCDIFKFPFKNTELSIIGQRPCALTNQVFRHQILDALSKKSD
jgi:hypothetical protein